MASVPCYVELELAPACTTADHVPPRCTADIRAPRAIPSPAVFCTCAMACNRFTNRYDDLVKDQDGQPIRGVAAFPTNMTAQAVWVPEQQGNCFLLTGAITGLLRSPKSTGGVGTHRRRILRCRLEDGTGTLEQTGGPTEGPGRRCKGRQHEVTRPAAPERHRALHKCCTCIRVSKAIWSRPGSSTPGVQLEAATTGSDAMLTPSRECACGHLIAITPFIPAIGEEHDKLLSRYWVEGYLSRVPVPVPPAQASGSPTRATRWRCRSATRPCPLRKRCPSRRHRPPSRRCSRQETTPPAARPRSTQRRYPRRCGRVL